MGDDDSGWKDGELRFVTYLAPSIPLALFEALAEHVERALGRGQVSLRAQTQTSGPQREDGRSYPGDDADVAFMCSPSFHWLQELRPPPMELLGVAPVFEDDRNLGRPVYFCDVVVRRHGSIHSFAELEGGSWAYNDAASLSGYYCLLEKLAGSGADESFFDSVLRSGSHLDSIESVLRGEADAAAIDSNVLKMRLRRTPLLHEKLRVIETWGPFPIQPVVVRSTLHPSLKERLRAAFLATQDDGRTHRILKRFGLSHFVAVSQKDYYLGAHTDLAKLLSAR